MGLYVHDHGRFCHLECWEVERKFERYLLRREELDITEYEMNKSKAVNDLGRRFGKIIFPLAAPRERFVYIEYSTLTNTSFLEPVSFPN